MIIEPINLLPQALPNLEQIEKSPPSFQHWINEQLNDTNHKLLEADLSLEQLATGKAESLHQTMLKLEQAKLSLQFLEQVRNRIMNAYQELMREQI